MKRIVSLTMSICLLAASALASAPEETLKLLILGNQKYVLENTLDEATVVTILADPAIEANPATLFGVAESRLNVIKAGDALPATGVTPVIIVLGLSETAVWEAYTSVLRKSPALIQAVLNGQTSVLGATLNADGAVAILGPHPDLLVMAGQYILDQPIQGSAPEKAESDSEESGETNQTPEEKNGHTDFQESENHLSSESHTSVSPDHAAVSGDSSGFLGILLAIAAIVGVVIALDRTVLRA